MSDVTFQTVALGRGAHASPANGACVVELASMLAGERFNDHPRSVCPVIAGFLRVYNDRVPEGGLDELYPLAPMVVGSASTWSVRRRRLRRLGAWAEAQDPRRRVGRLALRDDVVSAAAYAAAALDPRGRSTAVEELVADLVAVGTAVPAPDPAVPAASVPAASVPAEAPTAGAAAVTTRG